MVREVLRVGQLLRRRSEEPPALLAREGLERLGEERVVARERGPEVPGGVGAVEDAGEGSAHVQVRPGVRGEAEAITQLDRVAALPEAEYREPCGRNGQCQAIFSPQAQADQRQLRQQAPGLQQRRFGHGAQRELRASDPYHQVRGHVVPSLRKHFALQPQVVGRSLPVGIDRKPALDRLVRARVLDLDLDTRARQWSSVQLDRVQPEAVDSRGQPVGRPNLAGVACAGEHKNGNE